MLNLLLLAGRSNGLIPDENFDVISCNNAQTKLPELTLSIKQPYLDDNFIWLAPQFTLTDDGLFYKKIVPEDQLDVDLDDDFLFLNYYLDTTNSRRKRDDDVFDDISLGNKPQLQFTCKYPRDVEINSNLLMSSGSTQTDEDLTRTGFLEYQATVQNVQIGRDYFTEVLITPKHHLTNIYVVPKECRISSGENELFPIHSFGDEGLCLDERLEVQVLDMSQQVQFQYRTFRFESIKTIDQTHQIQCKLKLESVASTIEPDEIPTCTCFSNESCDTGSWSYWSDCDGTCKQTRIRNKDEIDEETESRDCENLCFLDVENEIDEDLKTCSIQNSRSRRDTKMTSQMMTSQMKTSRLMNGSSAFPGSLPYVVRLTFQNFDQFHSDTQQYNLCAGTVIDKNWILTSATCCKRDDIVTIKFNDYSVFYADNDEHEITSTLFHIHQDLDGCLIRTAVDMSDIVDKIPCIKKNFDVTSNMGARCWNPGWGSNTMNGEWATNLESIGVNLLDKLTCQMRSYWSNLYDNEICAVSSPTETTAINGYGYHVVAGGKETCAGDNGTPLLCDINGDITLVGVNSRGFDECGAEGYPAIHISMNSINSWVDDVILNESGIIWTEWSQCDSDCKQTRTRTKYESEIRECKGVCFKPTIDIIDASLGTCSVSQDRKRRNAQPHNRIMGGQEVVQGTMPYVAKLEFKQNIELNQLCAGTVINQYFIATTKFCCESGNMVAISFEGDSSSISSNTFYLHSTLDACLIRVETDLSMRLNEMPCLPTNIDINLYNGAACWNAGWGTSEIDGVYSDSLQSVGVNLMSQAYCTDHSFWEVTNGHICAGLPPNDSTPMQGWKHVTAGGKETCQGDYGAPLICDIAGTATLIGINSDGDLTECGLPGKPAIHVDVLELNDWMTHIINDHSPPKTCFKLVSDPSIPNSLGDEIKIFKNEVELGVALNTNQLSNEVCFDDTHENDLFKFMTAGNDNVFIKEFYINDVLKDLTPFWIDQDGDLQNDPYTTDCSTETNLTHPHAYSDVTMQNGQVYSKTCIVKQPVYSIWSVYSSCSKTCDGGEQSRTRECEGGICSLSSPDDLLQTQLCNTESCTVYSEWSVYSTCSKTCGGGEQSRSRQCIGGECSLVTSDDLEQTQTCNLQGCPVVLVLSTLSSENVPLILDFDGNTQQPLDFEYGDGTESHRGCGATLKNIFWYFGGISTSKRQLSKIVGCKLEHQMDLTFDFAYGACNTFTQPEPKVVLCFGLSNKKDCRTFDGEIFESTGSSQYTHAWTFSIANYQGKPLTTGCYQGSDGCNVKTELMDLNTLTWSNGPDYPFTSDEIAMYATASTSEAAYVIGGRSSKDVIAEFKNNVWSQFGTLTRGRYSHQSISMGDEWLIIGGLSDGNDATVTEVWNFKNEQNRVINHTLEQNYSYGIGLFVVPANFCIA